MPGRILIAHGDDALFELSPGSRSYLAALEAARTGNLLDYYNFLKVLAEETSAGFDLAELLDAVFRAAQFLTGMTQVAVGVTTAATGALSGNVPGVVLGVLTALRGIDNMAGAAFREGHTVVGDAAASLLGEGAAPWVEFGLDTALLAGSAGWNAAAKGRGGTRPPWLMWEQYGGERERTYPSGFGAPMGSAPGTGPGRGIAPAFVEDAIATGSARTVVVNGVERTIYTSGTVQVVTERGGRIVVSVNPFAGN